jgi:hypothetical protein
MALPTLEEAHRNLESAQARGAIQVDLQIRVATFAAVVQVEAADRMARANLESAELLAAASDALRQSVDRFTEASNRGTEQLATWSRNTATWTKWLTVATFALVLSSIVQIFVLWLTSN